MEYRAKLELKGARVLIVVAKFNELITMKLLEGAKQTFISHGLSEKTLDVVYVPGAYELGQFINIIIEKKKYDGVLALGCVIRGETSHYDYVCSSTASSLMEASFKSKKPVSFGVLTVDTLEQAFHRSGGKAGNKGSECALSLIEMINLVKEVKTSDSEEDDERYY